MSISQASSAALDLMAAVLSMETKSITSARSKWSKRCTSGRRLVVTGHLRRQFVQHVGLHPDELHDGVAAEPAPIQHQRGIVGVGAGIGIGTSSNR